MADTQNKANSSWIQKGGKVFGWIFGAAVGSYSGINLLIPLGVTAGAWWAGKRILNSTRLPYLPALAIQTGHLVWLSFGLAVIGVLNLNIIDVVVLVIGITWLTIRPGLGPIIFLTVFQVLAFGINVAAFVETAVGSNGHKALVVHLIWRVLAVFFMWRAYVQTRKVVAPETAPAGS
jgi:hypothetical protein